MLSSGPGPVPPNNLAGILRRRREELGLSAREAARRIGISPSYLLALEQGRNPSTGRAPVPSVRVLAAIGRALTIERATLLDASGGPISPSAHLLLYQTGDGYPSPVEAARRLFTGRVDAWIEMTDPRRSGDVDPSPQGVVIRRRQPWARARFFESRRVRTALADALADLSSGPPPRLGIVFGASSAALRSVENPPALLQSETTWEDDVGAEVRAAVGVAPAACVCVYREADIQELAARLDPLATVLSLIQTHAHVAVYERGGAMTTGPAAIARILASARPAGASSGTWESLSRAAAVGLARETATAHLPTRSDDA